MKTLALAPRSLALAVLLPTAAALAENSPATPAAHWEGKIQLDPQHELNMTVDLAPKTGGGWAGTISFPPSTTRDVPLDELNVESGGVKFSALVPGYATFAAQLSADGEHLAGTATNPQGDATFDLKRSGVPNVNLPPPSSPLPKEFAGTWEGTVDKGDGKTRHVGLRLASAKDGTAKATLVVFGPPDQEFPFSTAVIKDKALDLEARVISGRYRGTLGANGEIAGEWIEGAKALPLTFKPSAAKP